jgi:hypothetical protein
MASPVSIFAFNTTGYAVQWPAHPPCPALVIQGGRDRQGVGVDFDDRIEPGSATIDFFNPGKKMSYQFRGTELTARHRLLKLADG